MITGAVGMWQRLPVDDPARRPQRVGRAITAVTVGVFGLIATSWRPWKLFARGGYSADFYDEQARVFLRGRLAVDPAVAGIEGFLIDGQTYFYYGPMLALVRLPTALFGSAFTGRLTIVSMLVALVVLCTWSFRLLGAGLELLAGRRLGAFDGWRIAVGVGAVAWSPALFLAGWTSVYHETELWACAFAVIAGTAMIELVQRPHPTTLAVAGAATVATVLTRASVGVGVAAALLAVGAIVTRRDRRLGVVAVGVAVVGVAAHAVLNLAKFGSLFSLPADRQVLTLVDPERAAWFAGNDGSFFSARFLPTTVLQYLRPDAVRFERLVPWVRFGPLADDVGGYPVETITPSSSLVVTAPVLLLCAVIGVVTLLRRRCWLWLAVTAGFAVGAVPSFTIGFVANRYLVDMLPALIVPAAAGTWALTRPGWLPVTAGRVAVAAALTWSLWANASLATWTLGLKSPGFTELRYRIDDAVFPAPSPGLVALSPGSPVPRDGVVAVEPDCAGVYVAEQDRWVALERRPGRRELSGHVPPEVPAPVLAAAGDWTLGLLGIGPEAMVALSVDGVEVSVQPIGDVSPGDEVRVVADPVIPQLSVTIEGRTVLFDPTLPSRDDRPMTGDLDAAPGTSTPLCDLLGARLP
jgi:hypothetical protein